MSVVHLLGEPRIERDGELVPSPRGRKAWAVLAFVILGEIPGGSAPIARGRGARR